MSSFYFWHWRICVLMRLNKGAFQGCKNLKNVIMPAMSTSIGERTFKNCEKLGKVTLSNKLKTIDNAAFYLCKSLSEINYSSTKAEWTSIKKEHLWNSLTGYYTIHCTDGDIPKNES